MRQAFCDMIGNDDLRRAFAADIAEEHLSHAYILEGAAGSGKHMLALRIAAALACEHRKDSDFPIPCMKCAACKKVLGGNSPDVIYVNKEDKATLGVEAVRSLKSDVYIAPNDISTKIYIIEEAHLLTHQAQNALLLTLEEPPSYVLFLLLCESTATLLETIRSRAPTRRLEPIDPPLIARRLKETIPEAARMPEEELAEIVTVADGSIGRAIALLDPKLYKPITERRRTAREFISLCMQKRVSAQAIRFLNAMGTKRDELTAQFNEILLCLRDLLLCKQSENAPLCFFASREEACTLAYSFTTPTLLALCESVQSTIEKLRLNANVRLALITMASHCGWL